MSLIIHHNLGVIRVARMPIGNGKRLIVSDDSQFAQIAPSFKRVASRLTSAALACMQQLLVECGSTHPKCAAV